MLTYVSEMLLTWSSFACLVERQHGEHFGSPCTRLQKGEGLSGPALLLKEQSRFAQDAGKSLTLVSLDGSRGSPEAVTSNLCRLAEAFPCLAYPGACGPALPSQEKSCPPQAAFSQARD